MDMTLFENAFGYRMYKYDQSEAELQEHIKADEKTRQLLASKGIELSNELENDSFFVSLLFMVISVWEMDDIDSFIDAPYIKAFRRSTNPCYRETHPVKIELQNGYDLIFGVTGEKNRYNFEVLVHNGPFVVTNAPVFRMLRDPAVPQEGYIPALIAALPSDAHFQTEFETLLGSNYDAALDAYDASSYDEVDKKVQEEREELIRRYSLF